MSMEAGLMKVPDDLHVEGNLAADIEVGGRLVIHDGATVKGSMRAKTIVLAGTATGHIEAKEQFVLKSTGSIAGHVRASHLVIEPGATTDAEIVTSVRDRAERRDQATKAKAEYEKALASAAAATGKSFAPSNTYNTWVQHEGAGDGPKRQSDEIGVGSARLGAEQSTDQMISSPEMGQILGSDPAKEPTKTKV